MLRKIRKRRYHFFIGTVIKNFDTVCNLGISSVKKRRLDKTAKINQKRQSEESGEIIKNKKWSVTYGM